MERPEGFSFISGQYCMLTIVGALQGESRPFTISSSPAESDYLEFTIKQTGEFTGQLFKCVVGDTIEIKGPFGNSLLFDEHIHNDIVYIAGGSGIAPFLSSLRYADDKKLSNKFTLLYSNRTQEDIICKADLDSFDKDRLKVIYCLTRETPEVWDGELGHLDKENLLKLVSDPLNKTWYICAPPAMVNSLKQVLEEMGVERIYTEAWQVPPKK